jgi:hypothetical protein
MTITVTVTGANITTGAASAAVAIPTDASGVVARRVRVAATSAAHVRIGTVGLSAVATDLLLQPNDAVKLTVPVGCTHIAAIQDTSAGVVNVVPLEGC